VEEVPNAKTWSFLPFEVLFDSLRQSALVGVRDMGMSHRQVSLQSEDYCLDVRWDNDARVEGGSIVGQLISSDAEPVCDVPVMLVAGGRVVDRSTTSEFGEFQAEGLPSEALEVYVLVGEDSCISVVLDEGKEIA
jgi:hypothetical protein